MEQLQREDGRRNPMMSPLEKDPDNRILWVSQNAPESYEYGAVEDYSDSEQPEKPLEECYTVMGATLHSRPSSPGSELHQTAEILCKLSDPPTINFSPDSDAIKFLTEASRYTIHPVYPPSYPHHSSPDPHGNTIQYPSPYPAFQAHPYTYPLPPDATKKGGISDEEWSMLTSPECIQPGNTSGSPVVEEFLQMNLPPDTPAEDRQGWYEFLCEDGGSEECWTKFLGGEGEGGDEWLEDLGRRYQGW